MQEKEMTALLSSVPANDERSPKPLTNDIVFDNNTFRNEKYAENNANALSLLHSFYHGKDLNSFSNSYPPKIQENNIDLEFIRADEIEPVEVSWLWKRFFPYGKLSLLSGDPGEGKSTFMLTIAAMLTRGQPLPFTDPRDAQSPMTVIYQTTEDDPEDTIIPRFIKAGGDRTKLYFIKEDKKALTFSDERIKEAIIRTDAKLFILDPISAYIGKVNMNAANEVRPQFSSLAQVAKETGCAIVAISHLNKAEGLKTLYRITGSIDISGSVRSVTMLLRDPTDRDKRYFAQAKSNLSRMGSCIAFRISENGIEFLEEIEATAEELMKKFQSMNIGRPDDLMQAAADQIRDMLSDRKLHPATECEARLTEAGFKQGTIKKAKKYVDARSVKSGDLWNWYLPEGKSSISQ